MELDYIKRVRSVLGIMDYDGFMLLVERDAAKFKEWEEKSADLSLDELEREYRKWYKRIADARDKYWDIGKDGKENDVMTFLAKISYFYYLTSFTWYTLSDYTDKLRKEYDSLKKSKKKVKKSRKRKL